MIHRSDVKRFARKAVSTITYFSGYCFLAGLLGTSHGTRILAYHSISDNPTNSFAVSTRDFARQIQFLAERFAVISIDELVNLLLARKPIPPRTVAISIDDGFSDAYTNAYPILQKFAVPATIFLPTEFIGTSNLISKLPLSDFLSWDEVREMSWNGIAFGSHTLNHTSLTKLTPQEVRYQLESSKAKLEDELGKPVTGFSYPYGTVRDLNPQVKQLVKAAGYLWAADGLTGVNNQNADLFALRRTKVEMYDGMYVFEKAMRGALDLWALVDKYGWFLQGKNR